MKRILVILSLALAVAACHKPEYVLPTAERQGITSLTAYFTFGQYEDQELAKLDISNPDISRFVIPVPYYYPETSDDETEIYMIKVRLRAELQPNCSITPPLSIVDLTEENHFTYTDASGASRDIVITGERVHSSKAQLMTFDIVDPPISGIIDEESHKVSLVSADDLSAAVAKVSISAHASISPDPAEPHDYNNGFTFTVTAANGVDKTEYTVVKEVPEKIDYGFNSSSVKQLFNLDPVSNAGMPPYTEKAYISLAVTGNNLVVSTGDGAPSYFNKLTGVKTGAVNTGSATVASVTSDEGGNLLMFNHAEGGAEFSIWKSSSVSEEPTLFHSFTNSSDLPMGYKVKVIGDVNADAQIVATLEGIDGITSSSKFWSLKVEGGKVVSETIIDASATGMAWGSAPVNGTSICAVSPNPADGWFGACYDPNIINWIKSDGTSGAQCGTSNGESWGWNANCFDSKRFNNATFMSMFIVSHFPSWGIGPKLYVYDIANPSAMTGEFESCSPLVMSNNKINWFQIGGYAIASGDVVMAPSVDGFMLYIYYYDHNSQVIGGYSADCIKR